jgi:hypothetical protein
MPRGISRMPFSLPFSYLVVAKTQWRPWVVHKSPEFIFPNGINYLQRFFETHSSFSAYRSVPSNREPDRTHGVSGH